jgi:2-dehydropantoate 2-reductase
MIMGAQAGKRHGIRAQSVWFASVAAVVACLSRTREEVCDMNVLIVGAGVIGTIYGAQLGAAGHEISVLAHGDRTDAIAARGLCARDVSSAVETHAPARVVPSAGEPDVDIVLVALRRDDLQSAAGALAEVTPDALVLFMGNNPAGRSGLPSGSGARVALGFPGVGGTIGASVATYYKIAQQPTAIEATDEPRLAVLADALTARGLPVQRVVDMDGWLAYHAVFVATICAALYRCGTDPQRLAHDRATLKLMCRAITQGFQELHATQIQGCPRNLAVLHNRWLAPVAIRYWARVMRSPMGELAFAAHARHAKPEMRTLAHDVLTRLPRRDSSDALQTLLAPRP